METGNDTVPHELADTGPLSEGSADIGLYPARQPIIDGEGLLCGFELILRDEDNVCATADAAERGEGAEEPAAHVAAHALDTDAQAQVRAQAEAEAEAARVLGALAANDVHTALAGHRGYINASRALLFSEALQRVSPDRFFLEVPPGIEADSTLIAQLMQLHAKRYRFVLDDVRQPDATFAKLLPYAYAVKVDIDRVAPELLPKLASVLKSAGKLLIALNVDSHSKFERAQALGFDLYQGYFFAHGGKQTARRVSAPQHALLNLLRLLSADPSVAQLEAELKLNPVLVMHLMRLANSGEASIGRKVATLRDAIIATGTNRIARWTQLLLYADGRKIRLEDDPLVQLAATRARFMELASARLAQANRKVIDGAFLTGVFSLVDAVFGGSLQSTLDELALASHIRDAILHREGPLGTLLEAIVALEQGDWAALDRASATLEPLTPAKLAELGIAAAAWATSSDQSDEHAHLEQLDD